MTRDEALVEWDRLMEAGVVPKDQITPEAKEKAAALFAALYPVFEDKDEVSANMLMEHNETVIRTMAQAYQALMNKEQKKDEDDFDVWD